MDVPHLVRAARRRAGLSQRAFAVAAGVSRTTLADAERGKRLPSLAVLQRVVTTAGLTLTLAAADEPPDDALRRYLRRPLAERLRMALGDPPQVVAPARSPVWHELRTLSWIGAVVLQPPLAHRIWLAQGPATPARVVLHTPRTDVPTLAHVEVSVEAGPRPSALVSVALDGPRQVWVPTPDELALDDVASRMRQAAALLHDEAARDDADRRRPPHRDPQDWWEYDRVLRTKSVRDPSIADPTRSRAWRIGGPASLAQHVARGGRLGA